MLETGFCIGFICLKQALGTVGELTGQTTVTSLIHKKFTIAVGRYFTVQSEFLGIFRRIVSEQIPVAAFDSFVHFFLAVGHAALAKGMVAWGKENAAASGLSDAPIRWIVDDCAKFVEREIRRGRKYDAIIMDPPSYGRGPGGEVWKLEQNLWPFVSLCAGVLSDDPLFVIINSYTTGLSPSVLSYVTESIFTKKFGGRSESRELGLPVTDSGLVLPCGATCRWERD